MAHETACRAVNHGLLPPADAATLAALREWHGSLRGALGPPPPSAYGSYGLPRAAKVGAAPRHQPVLRAMLCGCSWQACGQLASKRPPPQALC